MKKSGLAPNIVTYNTFVASYSSLEMFGEAMDVLEYMKKQKCKPNERTYNAIEDGICKVGRFYEATIFAYNIKKSNQFFHRKEEARLVKRIRCVDAS